MARSIDDLVDDFDLFEDWEERYRYIVDMGKKLPPMPDSEKTPETKVNGCMSQVWMTCQVDESTDPVTLSYHADSDAFIVKGLIAILLDLYSGLTPQQTLDLDAASALTRLGLESHLSPNRRNGFVAMVGRIRAEAQARL